MTARSEPIGAGAKVWENPLVPHRRMREMYGAMLGARLLDEWLAARPLRGKKALLASTRGEEACRVSTLIGLERGDLVVDPTQSVTTNYLLGASGASLAKASRGEDPVPLESGRRGRRLELGGGALADAGAVLRIALGAALALKAQGGKRVLLTFAAADTVDARVWTEILGSATRLVAPMVLVALPGRSRAGLLSSRATRLGVPGIAVEARDAVALFRVAQEAMVRIRMGGGPVLMECVRVPGNGSERADPIDAMRGVLLAKGAADERWVDGEAARLGRRLLGQLEAGDA